MFQTMEVPVEIICRVLSLCPSRADLLSIITSSRIFYNSFGEYKTTILYEVYFTETARKLELYGRCNVIREVRRMTWCKDLEVCSIFGQSAYNVLSQSGTAADLQEVVSYLVSLFERMNGEDQEDKQLNISWTFYQGIELHTISPHFLHVAIPLAARLQQKGRVIDAMDVLERCWQELKLKHPRNDLLDLVRPLATIYKVLDRHGDSLEILEWSLSGTGRQIPLWQCHIVKDLADIYKESNRPNDAKKVLETYLQVENNDNCGIKTCIPLVERLVELYLKDNNIHDAVRIVEVCYASMRRMSAGEILALRKVGKLLAKLYEYNGRIDEARRLRSSLEKEYIITKEVSRRWPKCSRGLLNRV